MWGEAPEAEYGARECRESRSEWSRVRTSVPRSRRIECGGALGADAEDDDSLALEI